MATVFLIIGICFIVASFMERKAEKERKEQRLFNENCYSLFEEHRWLKFDDDAPKKKHKKH